jgi:flavin-dependent dehydrogenase
MTPPVTGNGMSMAFESAELAVPPLAAYSRGEIEWGEARRRVACACDSQFYHRLKWAKWLQSAMFSSWFQRYIGAFVLRSSFVWHTMYQNTR